MVLIYETMSTAIHRIRDSQLMLRQWRWIVSYSLTHPLFDRSDRSNYALDGMEVKALADPFGCELQMRRD